MRSVCFYKEILLLSFCKQIVDKLSVNGYYYFYKVFVCYGLILHEFRDLK